MSAGVLFARPDMRVEAHPEDRVVAAAGGWNPEDFAREQIRGLVRKVFLSKVERPVRQVVFSALDSETDVRNICRRVGETLAMETVGNVAIVGAYPRVLPGAETYQPEIVGQPERDANPQLRQSATRVQSNLWLVPGSDKDGDQGGTAALHSYMGEIRSVFEYSVVEGRRPGNRTRPWPPRSLRMESFWWCRPIARGGLRRARSRKCSRRRRRGSLEPY